MINGRNYSDQLVKVTYDHARILERLLQVKEMNIQLTAYLITYTSKKNTC